MLTDCVSLKLWRLQTTYVIFKNVKNTHGGVLLLVKLQTKINTPPWVFLTFFKLYKWYQIAQRITLYVTKYYFKEFENMMLDILTSQMHELLVEKYF